MNYKEAISILDSFNLKSKADKYDMEALDIGLEAIKKQMPQKPLAETKYYGIGKCPRCGAVFLDKATNYCGNCGQALDWNN